MDKRVKDFTVHEHIQLLHFCTIMAIEKAIVNDPDTNYPFTADDIILERVIDFVRATNLLQDAEEQLRG